MGLFLFAIKSSCESNCSSARRRHDMQYHPTRVTPTRDTASICPMMKILDRGYKKFGGYDMST
jgi:hypothetical protein